MHTATGHTQACGFDNPPGAMFCGSCGQPLFKACGRCGTQVPAGFSFCTVCGNPLPETASVHAAPMPHAQQSAGEAGVEPTSERRLVSVLFCDLVDFTGMAERLDPEEVRDILSRYFDAARDIVGRHGGVIEKFIGDAIVGVWGSPIAREDDAERAVSAALEIVEAVGNLRSPGLSQPLLARAAVATGESAVTIGAVNQGMVAGDIVNTASRLQSAAEPGTVLMNDAARRSTAGSIVARPAGQQRLKGKSRLVHSWRAIRAGVSVGGRPRDEPPLVGRRHELQELLSAVSGGRRRPRARLISVIGVAGIGKTRLLSEVARRLAERSPGTAWRVGRVPRDGGGTPFTPLADIVRQALHIAERDASGVARRKLSAALPAVVADAAERAWVEPRLAVLLDPDEGRFEGEELFAAWRRYLELLAEHAPLTLVLEDAHRAHPALLDFVGYAVEMTRDRPLVFITAARPELLEARPGWGAGIRSFTSLHLERMPNAEMTRLLSGLHPGLAPAAVAQILQRADGVPLYAVELTRMLQDGGWAAGGASLAQADLPATLHALIASRIDALSADERSLLMSAAVLGRSFSAEAVAAVYGVQAERAAPTVERLLRQQILRRDPRPRPEQRGQLSFQEQLVQDVAYRTLARGDRRRHHLAAAAYLERLDDEELVERVADHLVKAFRADPSHQEAGEISARAIPALLRAAQRAAALNAPNRALEHLEVALVMAPDARERDQILEQAATAAQSAGLFESAERYWRQVIEHRAAASDAVGVARGRARLASLLLVAQRNDAAMAELEEALGGLGDLGQDENVTFEIAGQLARSHLLRGDSLEAIDWAERAMAGAGHLKLAEVATDALITRGAARLRVGEHDRGIDDLNTAIAQCSASHLLGLELRARTNLAWLTVAEDPNLTIAAARQGFETGRQKGMRDMALTLGSVAFATAIDTGDWDWALAAIDNLVDEPMSPAHRIDLAATATILRALRGVPAPGKPLSRLEPFAPDTDEQVLAQVGVARAWLAFLGRRFVAAGELARDAAGSAIGPSRHAALLLAARTSVWARDPAALEAHLDQLTADTTAGRAAAAGVRALQGAGLAMAGEADAGGRAYQEAVDAFREIKLPLAELLTRLERLAMLPDDNTEDTVAVHQLAERLRANGLRRLMRGLA